MLPSITNVINLADSHDRAAFAMVTHVKQEPRERENSESKEEVGPRPRRLRSQPPGSLGGCSIHRRLAPPAPAGPLGKRTAHSHLCTV